MLSHQICLSQRRLSWIGLPLLPIPRGIRAPSPGSMFNFSASSGTATRTSALKQANRSPPLHCALNGLGILCLGMCYRRFTMLLRAPNGVSNEHSCSDRIFQGLSCSLDTEGGYKKCA